MPSVGAGLPLWLPDGAVIRAELETLAMEKALASGCRRVYTPVLAKRELFERSGHWEKFSEDMFPEMNVGGESFVLRPANCPHHTQVFAAAGRSYRDLPFRLAELGSMFRSELSGVLGGLSRVRQINLDDAHSFCTPDQAVGEIQLALSAIADCYRILGLDIQYYRLSTRGADGSRYLGSDSNGAGQKISSAPRWTISASGTARRRGRRRSTVRRSMFRSLTPAVVRKPCRPSRSTTTNPNVSG